MMEAHAQEIEGMRAYGFHSQHILFVDPRYLNRLLSSDRNLDPNTDLTFTLDVAHLADLKWTLQTVLGYRDVEVTLTERVSIPHLPKAISFLNFEEADMGETGIEEYMRVDSGPQQYLRARH